MLPEERYEKVGAVCPQYYSCWYWYHSDSSGNHDDHFAYSTISMVWYSCIMTMDQVSQELLLFQNNVTVYELLAQNESLDLERRDYEQLDPRYCLVFSYY
jgi:hypothetical protein